MKPYVICLCILLAVFLFWFVYDLLKPMSGAFIRYLSWTMTPTAVALRESVKTEDARIHYVSYGRGPAVLLLHGGLSNRRIWFSQIPWLVKAGRQVVLLDTRGHGASGLGTHALSYRLLASDAIHVLDKLNIRQADVIGWSDGGNTALQMGHYWPQRVKKIIAVSANFNPSGLIPKALEETRLQSSRLAHWFKGWWTGSGEKMIVLETRIKSMWRTRPMMEPFDVKNIAIPTLVIIGRKDIISLDHAKQMAGLLPHGFLEVIPGGHSTPVTHSNLVNAAVARFLEIQVPIV
jgi:pimeloyl-ACP methyl ester carboxylesterase